MPHCFLSTTLRSECSEKLGRYIPAEKLLFEYPADNPADSIEAEAWAVQRAEGSSIEADSNLLLHAEVEPPARPAFGSGAAHDRGTHTDQ